MKDNAFIAARGPSVQTARWLAPEQVMRVVQKEGGALEPDVRRGIRAAAAAAIGGATVTLGLALLYPDARKDESAAAAIQAGARPAADDPSPDEQDRERVLEAAKREGLCYAVQRPEELDEVMRFLTARLEQALAPGPSGQARPHAAERAALARQAAERCAATAPAQARAARP